ncbi:MAG: hypothetical protein I3273_05145 [Candidatus Moeniiplasma glomeromycotorum]|nr:hypothetical protein [Candidatus Moeniiplasma glomeromycotorum]
MGFINYLRFFFLNLINFFLSLLFITRQIKKIAKFDTNIQPAIHDNI